MNNYLIVLCQCLFTVSASSFHENYQQLVQLKGYQILESQVPRVFSEEITNHVAVYKSTVENRYKIVTAGQNFDREILCEFHSMEVTVQCLYDEKIILLVRKEQVHHTLCLSFEQIEHLQIFYNNVVRTTVPSEQFNILILEKYNHDTDIMEEVVSSAIFCVINNTQFSENSFVVKSTNQRIQNGNVQVPYLVFHSNGYTLCRENFDHRICLSIEGDYHAMIYCLTVEESIYRNLYSLLGRDCLEYF